MEPSHSRPPRLHQVPSQSQRSQSQRPRPPHSSQRKKRTHLLSLGRWQTWIGIGMVTCVALFPLAAVHYMEPSEGGGRLIRRRRDSVVGPFQKPTTRVLLPSPPPPITIGYAISITACNGATPIVEGAAVLKHSIHLVTHRNHHHNPSTSTTTTTNYDYKMYAFHLPSTKPCALALEPFGYTLLERNLPVSVSDIQGDFLRTHIENNGCCGAAELLKLEAYTLVDHPIVVHLDLDVVLLQPLDALFDGMLLQPPPNNTTNHPTHTTNNNNNNNNNNTTALARRMHVMWPNDPLPETIDAFFTRDYNLIGPGRQYKPYQGGFLVVRPSLPVYQEFVTILRTGDFREHHGWGGKVGPFYGSQTIQGILPYFYMVLHPNTAVELNRCVYNQMSDNPRMLPRPNHQLGACRTTRNQDKHKNKHKTDDDESTCEDCRTSNISNVVSVHFTICQKPWNCAPQNGMHQQLCRKMHHEWFRIRSNLEQSLGNNGTGMGHYQRDHFFGFCKRRGVPGYVPIVLEGSSQGTLP